MKTHKINTKLAILMAVMFVITFLLSWLVQLQVVRQGSAAGYWTLGDIGVYLSAALLGGPFGAIASALGFALADIVTGHAGCALVSLVVKAAMALLFAWYIRRGNTILHLAKGVLYAGGLMVICYFCYDLLLMGNYAAAAFNLPLDCLQVIASGLIAAPVLFLAGGKSYRKGEGFGGAGYKGGFARSYEQKSASSRNLK